MGRVRRIKFVGTHYVFFSIRFPKYTAGKRTRWKYVKPEDTIQVGIESYVKMDMKRTEVILSISKVEVPENERNITHNTRVIDNSKPNNN